MNGSPKQETLGLEVADFGPIVEAKVDLRPLTVFVGPSNTGKSYLAILIYALHRFFSGGTEPVHRSFPWGYRILKDYEKKRLPNETISSLIETVQRLLDPREPTNQHDVLLPSPVMDLIRSGFDEGREDLGCEICRCFGIDDAGTLTRRGRRKGARIELRRYMSNDSSRFEHQLILAGQATDLRTTIPEEVPARIDIEELDEMREILREANVGEREVEERDYRIWWLMGILNDCVLPYLIGPLYLPAYYLPADRTGVMHAHSVMVSALIASAPTAGFRPAARTPMLSGGIGGLPRTTHRSRSSPASATKTRT